RVGEVEEYLSFIVKGLARMYFLKGKIEMITNIAKEGELIGASASFLSGKPGAGISAKSEDRKAGSAGDDLFCASKGRMGAGVYAAGYAGAVPAFYRQQSRATDAGAAKVPCLLFEYEAGDFQPAEKSHQKTPCRGATLNLYGLYRRDISGCAREAASIPAELYAAEQK
ncbi:MAG TPA: hypothetical protein VG101_02890, partial [Puia sp.]|nr:hypothetical protein [Puia sp.]